MENPILTMKRYELKYILTKEQTNTLKERLVGFMQIDKYGLTSIASLYYDTTDFRIIRASIEKPEYKEKIRLRSYGLAKEGSTVFLELKRKASGIVYKRRISTTEEDVCKFLNYEGNICADGQIAREITYFRGYYEKLVPACLIIYDRLAYYEPNGDLRLTIDSNPRYRTTELNLSTSMEGTSLLPDGYSILEIKVQDAMPMWLAKILSEEKIYNSNYSKYGAAYKSNYKKFEMEVLKYV
ncbi:MAG: polyphosphate polymerase domain-containing protein [Bacilli bacterium]|nr:polyphosphate polymerase domain-containing protein [Bacilli bacterium]